MTDKVPVVDPWKKRSGVDLLKKPTPAPVKPTLAPVKAAPPPVRPSNQAVKRGPAAPASVPPGVHHSIGSLPSQPPNLGAVKSVRAPERKPWVEGPKKERKGDAPAPAPQREAVEESGSTALKAPGGPPLRRGVPLPAGVRPDEGFTESTGDLAPGKEGSKDLNLVFDRVQALVGHRTANRQVVNHKTFAAGFLDLGKDGKWDVDAQVNGEEILPDGFKQGRAVTTIGRESQKFDAEVKVTHLAYGLMAHLSRSADPERRPDSFRGRYVVIADRGTCTSCQRVVTAFSEVYPNIQVYVGHTGESGRVKSPRDLGGNIEYGFTRKFEIGLEIVPSQERERMSWWMHVVGGEAIPEEFAGYAAERK